MPVLNGVDATLEIRNLPLGKNAPIVALTAEVFVGKIQYFIDSELDEVKELMPLLEKTAEKTIEWWQSL